MLIGITPMISPKGKFIEVKDGGHWLMQECPEETQKILLDFLLPVTPPQTAKTF